MERIKAEGYRDGDLVAIIRQIGDVPELGSAQNPDPSRKKGSAKGDVPGSRGA